MHRPSLGDVLAGDPELAGMLSDRNHDGVVKLSSQSTRKVWWVCQAPDCGAVTEIPVKRKVRDHGLCMACNPGKGVFVPGVTDVATKLPDVAAEWGEGNELPPNLVHYSSASKFEFRCKECGHVWWARLDNRARGIGCPECGRRRGISKAYRDDQFRIPDGSKVPAELRRMFVCSVSGDVVRLHTRRSAVFRCPDCGHGWSEPVKTFERFMCCPFCAGGGMSGQTGRIPPNKCLGRLLENVPELGAEYVGGNPDPFTLTTQSAVVVDWVCGKGHEWSTPVYQRVKESGGTGCPVCSVGRSSTGEQEVADFVESVLPEGSEIIRNDRSVIKPLELDIVVPDRRIAVEFNGIYWHSEGMGKDRRYHRDKWQAARDAGYQLITVWEDDWRDNRPVVEAMLRHKLGVDFTPGIGARKCRVVTLGYRESAGFLDQHHIQGSATGSVYFGLRAPDGILVAVAVYRRVGAELFLDRYATSCPVPGGMGRLLKAGCVWGRGHGCSCVVTFSDHEVSDGGLYDRLGFTRDRELAPDYKYVYGGVRHHKFGFRLKRFREDPALEYQEGLSERELAELNGIPRVWDAGKTRHVLPL